MNRLRATIAIGLATLIAFSGCISAPASSNEDLHSADSTNQSPLQHSNSTSPDAQGNVTGNATDGNGESGDDNQTKSWDAPPLDSRKTFGELDGTKVFRPGIQLNDGSCTTNFLFHENGTRFFLGTAAHCVSDGDDGGELWYCNNEETDSEVQLTGRDGTTITVPVVYSSADEMTRLGETDEMACGNNDFALLELPPDALDRTHPAVLFFGGPTALDQHELATDDTVYFFGNSGLRDGEFPNGHPGESELGSNCYGKFRYYSYDGWDFKWDFTTQPTLQEDGLDGRPTAFPIPGDSGGPFLGPTGKALAMLGGGANNLEYSLAWMEENMPWHVELVTWDEFDPDGIELVKPI